MDAEVRDLLGMVAALTLTDACGGGADDDGDDGWTVSYGEPTVMVGQVDQTIYRFHDASGDGDHDEAGERTCRAHPSGTQQECELV